VPASRKVVARIKGGLGNQLFCYAAARRLALVNNAELVIDDVTGFVRDHQYRRRYALQPFQIAARRATPTERLEPFERYRRGLMKLLSRRKPFEKRRYVEQQGPDFDPRLLRVKVEGTIQLDGLWQSERYFEDIEPTIRSDLTIAAPSDVPNQHFADRIRETESVALHVRYFDAPGAASIHNAAREYYERAIALMEARLAAPHYFLFSDDSQAAIGLFRLPKERLTVVSHNRGDGAAYADLWLMTQCKHFITANSTFSWWAAWLGANHSKVIITPAMKLENGTVTSWNFPGQIPERWVKL
jgi:hypothetical protein